MDDDNWRIWNSNDQVELRTYLPIPVAPPVMTATLFSIHGYIGTFCQVSRNIMSVQIVQRDNLLIASNIYRWTSGRPVRFWAAPYIIVAPPSTDSA